MKFIKFVGVGGLATGIHYLILMALVEFHLATAVVATTVGYLVSSLFNYGANYYLTFRSRASHMTAAVRFYIVAGVGLALNSIIVYLINDVANAHYLLAQVVATVLVMCWNYIAHKNWTYISV